MGLSIKRDRNASNEGMSFTFLLGRFIKVNSIDIVDMDTCHLLLGRSW